MLNVLLTMAPFYLITYIFYLFLSSDVHYQRDGLTINDRSPFKQTTSSNVPKGYFNNYIHNLLYYS